MLRAYAYGELGCTYCNLVGGDPKADRVLQSLGRRGFMRERRRAPAAPDGQGEILALLFTAVLVLMISWRFASSRGGNRRL